MEYTPQKRIWNFLDYGDFRPDYFYDICNALLETNLARFNKKNPSVRTRLRTEPNPWHFWQIQPSVPNPFENSRNQTVFSEVSSCKFKAYFEESEEKNLKNRKWQKTFEICFEGTCFRGQVIFSSFFLSVWYCSRFEVPSLKLSFVESRLSRD